MFIVNNLRCITGIPTGGTDSDNIRVALRSRQGGGCTQQMLAYRRALQMHFVAWLPNRDTNVGPRPTPVFLTRH